MISHYRECLGNLLNLCWVDLEVTRTQVEKVFPIKSKTQLTTAIKDLIEESYNTIYSFPEYTDSSYYLANIMRAIVYLTQIRDKVVGNTTLGGRRDYK